MTDIEETICRDLSAYIGEPVREVRSIPQGHSGFTYWVELDGRRAVLRLPPPGARIAGPADIPRQARIMGALHAQGFPVPAVLGASAEAVVAGRPFVLTEAIAAERIEESFRGGADAERLATSAVEVLRSLQGISSAKTGIGDEDPMLLDAELERWVGLMERAPSELTKDAPRLASVLANETPAARPAVLVHGDYHYGNMLFRNEQVVAVVDWEIAQIGQPLLDLCCLYVAAQAGGPEDEEGGPAGRWSVPVDTLRATYGADADDFRWYLALTYYKYAAIFGYNLTLHRRGKRHDPTYERRTETIVRFIDTGIATLDHHAS